VPKKIDVKERCVQQMLEHAQEYPKPTAAAEAVAKRNGVGERVGPPLVFAGADRRRAAPGRDE
jgi:hypothetical protein